MIRKLLALTIAAILMGTTLPSTAATVPKSGSACSQVGQKKTASGKIFTCIKSGSKKVWNKGIAQNVSYSPKGWVGDYCGTDPAIKGTGALLQNYLVSERRCVATMRLVAANLPTETPKAALSQQDQSLSAERCKLQKPTKTQNGVWKGFPGAYDQQQFDKERHPSPKTVMQIVPVYSKDAPRSGKTPAEDYKFYFDFIKSYFDYINDGPGGIEIRIPDSYYEFPGLIEPYDVYHGNDGPLGDAFINKAISVIDGDVDFGQVSYALIVVPAGTPSEVIAQQGFGNVVSNEGRLHNVSIAQPATFSGNRNSVMAGMASPSMWLHEFYHPGLNLGDNHASYSPNYDSGRGMGSWGLMSGDNGDLLVWQKWILGFLQDSQVRCISISAESPSTHWIAPSTVKTTKEKMLVIRASDTKALIVESIRANGLNYRFFSSRLGALVYEVDVADIGHDTGYSVMYPDNRRPNPQDRYLMSDAPLKVGESLIYGSVKISNIEWGDFGDVIKVEPVAK